MPVPPHLFDDPLDGGPDSSGSDELLRLDLLRVDLYRLLDELVRAGSNERPELVSEFEQAWERFKQASARH